MPDVRRGILDALGAACGEDAGPQDLKDSPVADFGSPIAFRLAKRLGRSPSDIAAELASKIRPSGVIASVKADGGYLNFTVEPGELAKSVLSGAAAPAKKPGKIILEHTSVNPTGPVHVGRIRNTVIGDCLRRILAYGGHEVETHYYVNDVGKQVAIIAAGLRDGLGPDRELSVRYARYSGREDYGVFFTYVRANRLFEDDTAFQSRVQSLIQSAEGGDEASLREITSAARRCLAGQMRTFERLGVGFDVFDYESEGLTDGSVDMVLDRARKSPDYVKSEVGEGIDLSGRGLGKRGGMTVLARADGTSVYLARDLAYHLKKLRLGTRAINVLGEDHKLEFQELKAILAAVFGTGEGLEVVHFSFVSFEGVKFSTRKGEIAAVDELLDEAVGKATAEAQKRGIGDEATARAVGVGAVKFHIVKTSPNKQITFRWEDALNFEGETAPYVQYAHARSCRMLEKAGGVAGPRAKVDYAVSDPHEKRLLLKLMGFEDAAAEACRLLRPDLIATYLIELTAAYGGFYMNCPVLEAPEQVRNRRLLLVGRLRDTIATGLGLLGIEAPQRM
jgi:arginyl-tRNA synthetase